MTTTVLLIEDEQAIRDMLAFSLPSPSYHLLQASNVHEALDQLQLKPDIVLLDWMLPGISGIEILKIIRKKDTKIYSLPVIMLTAKSLENDKIQGLSNGADDYITKPFSTRELKVRIEALLRRSHKEHDAHNILQFLDLRVDPGAHQVSINEATLKIGPTEYKLLHLFISNLNRAYSRGQLLDMIWDDDGDVLERTIDVHIRRLRKALAAHGYDQYLRTVWAVGYRFSEKE